MMFGARERLANGGVLLALSALFVVANFIWQGHDGFNLWDEGFLWYGARQVLAGEIPIRDFMAYDPGRYYWSAAFLFIFGSEGIIALRTSVALFQLFGVFAGLWVVSLALPHAAYKRVGYLFLSAITLMAWMYPRHKIFDISISMIVIAAITYLLIRPSAVRYFLLGMVVGMAAVFGRNHGVYGAVASIIALSWMMVNAPAIRDQWSGIFLWGVGIVIGYLPVLLMCLFVPGYFTEFLDTIVFMLGQGNTNLPLPIPWPWTVGFGTATYSVEARWLLIGVCFMALLIAGVAALLWVFTKRVRRHSVRPELVAIAAASLPYAHYAFARADVGHLAQAIYPLLLLILVLCAYRHSRFASGGAAVALAAVSVFVLSAWQPGVQARVQDGWEKVEVSGSQLSMDPSTAEAVNLLRKLTDEYSKDGRSVLVLPFWPGAYPLLNRHAPLWEIYALSPRSEDFQYREIERIKQANPGYVLIFDMAMDGREELRFSHSHRLIDLYVKSNFVQVEGSPNPAFDIYKARDTR